MPWFRSGDEGDRAGARGLRDQVLEARRRRLGLEHPDTRRAEASLSRTLERHEEQARSGEAGVDDRDGGATPRGGGARREGHADEARAELCS
jgi:hypothetical protein